VALDEHPERILVAAARFGDGRRVVRMHLFH
jgi:hypothetical protein